MNKAKLLLASAALVALTANHHGEAGDPATRAWWDLASEISGDAYEGRASGTPGHERAAVLVAHKLAEAGFKPLGTDGSWYQRVPLEELAVSFATLRADGGTLSHLDDFVVRPQPGVPSDKVYSLVYRGYCAAQDLGDVAGKMVICHNANRTGLPGDAEREQAVRAAGAQGVIQIADPGFVIEPPRWPFAYNKVVAQPGELPVADDFVSILLNADALEKLVPGHDAAGLITKGSTGQPLPSFDGGTARLTTVLRSSQYSTPNVIGYLPGSDPALADQAILLGAHLDGYGFGHAVDGDPLYNGTLDDAAYVALLIKFAEAHRGKPMRRPVIIGVWTGEELGLHGSRWFAAHPTWPMDRIAGVLNLDQLRPIFPLERLTTHGRTDSTLGDQAALLAAKHGFVLQDDPEPERRLILRTDHRPFMEAGIPFLNFTFGFEPGSESERIYRHWYRTGYHKPQDDPAQLMDWKAAQTFNEFWLELAENVANAPDAPKWHEGSPIRAQYAGR
ncbi:M28 family peptidase [Qipengyuania sp. RANM35]|uniref:M28 family peptidase n=1 Tax=Qipengyuania sp. RANM35 TaxID=3068635 RepID=UPI0034DB24E6